ncbi:MAG: ABC transporter ATP-binding protein, partial [Kiritimatiellae bacterium]|nr:ABC transporter ATP-binding protein [Kiritimatiellia bacterium]
MKVEILNLTRIFQRGFKAVDDLSFSFSSGEVVGFVGPNGAGKTTTMRILATLDIPDSGDILLDGKSILDDPALAHRAIGFMPDELPDRTDTTVEEYLDFFGRAYGLRGKALADALASVEDFTGLVSFRDKTLHELSKGMKQRVSL